MKPVDTPSRGDAEGVAWEIPSRFRGPLLAGVILCVITIATFWQVQGHEFIGFDDDHYVTENLHVRQGVSLDGILWAFTTTATGNWHPVTWLSHMVDVELFGLDPGKHHLVNLLLHAANTALLFLVFHSMTGALWRSAFSAALFALHPLHVESVAWIAERKDVLSTLFWLLTLWAYLRYTKKPSKTRYLPMAIFYAVGLMSKPMLVTLPFVLLLLDYWPLGRFGSNPPNGDPPPAAPRTNLLPLIVEKAPLFLLSACSCVVTYAVQKKMGAMTVSAPFSLGIRAANALVSYAAYLGKTFWPAGLAVYYPHPGFGLSLVHATGAFLLLLGISLFTVRQVSRSPYLAVGWFWYLGTLVPVIGLVQVGGQAMADRYTYVPLIGIFIAVSWGVPALFARFPRRAWILAGMGGGSVAAIVVLTWIQVGHWRTTETLFEHTLAVTGNNALAHSNLGAYLAKQGRKAEAVRHFLDALRIDPGDAVSHNNLGVIELEEGNHVQALKHFREALRHNPRYTLAHTNLLHAMLKTASPSEAIGHLRMAIKQNPDDSKTREYLGNALESEGNLREAIEEYRMAVRLREDNLEARKKLALLLVKLGEFKEAEEILREILRIRPEDTQARFNLGVSLMYLGRSEEAVSVYRQMLEQQPDDPKIHVNLGLALAAMGKLPEAVTEFRDALRLDPGDLKARNGLGVTLVQMGNLDEAFLHFRRALKNHPEDATTHFNLAMALNLQGKTEEAIRRFRKGLQFAPGNPEAMKQVELLERQKR